MNSRNYGELLTHANIACLEKLHENKDKPSWREMDIELIMWELWEEVYELQEAIATGDIREARREAADVANYCAFLINHMDRLIKDEAICVIADAKTNDGTEAAKTHGTVQTNE